MLVVGNTEVGIENKFRKIRYPVLIATSHIACMTLVEVIENGVKKKAEKIGKEKRCDRVGGIKGVGGLKVGVSCSLSEMEEALKKEVDGRAGECGKMLEKLSISDNSLLFVIYRFLKNVLPNCLSIFLFIFFIQYNTIQYNTNKIIIIVALTS